MANFVDHLNTEIEALQRDLERDPRSVKLRELRRIRSLYLSAPSAVLADSPTLNEVDARTPRRRSPSGRGMTPATEAVIAAAREIASDHIVPLRDLHHEIAVIRSIPIGGKDPLNNLSAMLARYGFEAVGRTGWRVRQNVDDDTTTTNSEPEPDPANLFSVHALNGAAHEIRGAAPL